VENQAIEYLKGQGLPKESEDENEQKRFNQEYKIVKWERVKKILQD
jgi:hypothetical protein